MAAEYRSGSRVRCIVLLCLLFTICGVIYLGYFCPEKVCALTNVSSQRQHYHQMQKLHQTSEKSQFSRNAYGSNDPNYDFDDTHTKNFWDSFSADDAEDQNVAQLLSEQHAIVQQQQHMAQDLRFPVKIVGVSFDDLTLNSSKFSFDLLSRDVIVFLHIQKTGGTTFGRHLVHDLDLDKPCECKKRGKRKRKRCMCLRPNSKKSYWLFSRFSTGWQCGLHADWTELTSCVDSVLNKEEGGRVKRRYYYITLLRDPVVRFLSEYLHVKRGATWKAARHWCGGREATAGELPPCYEGEMWEDVSLDDFLLCPSNLAINRQTRMLADLTLVGCYNASALNAHQRESLMLASAKENLRRLAYFALCEFQQIGQYMFEETFHLNFLTTFQQFNETHVTSVFKDVTPEQMERVRQLNYLDVQLYEFAKKLMYERIERMKRQDADFHRHFQGLARQPSRTYQGEESDSN